MTDGGAFNEGGGRYLGRRREGSSSRPGVRASTRSVTNPSPFDGDAELLEGSR